MKGFAFPGFEPPGFWLDTSNLVFPAYEFPGYAFPGYAFPGENPVFVVQPPIVLTNELVEWIGAKLGKTPLPNHLPQSNDTYPVISFTIFDGDTIMNLASPAGVSYIDVQFTIWSLSSMDAAMLQKRLLVALGGYRGPMGRAYCQAALAGRPNTTYTKAVDGSDDGTYGDIREYRIWFTEPLS